MTVQEDHTRRISEERDNWQETARLYAQNADYWRGRAETAEAAVATSRLFDGLQSAFAQLFGGADDDAGSGTDDGCPNCHSACPCRQ